MDIVLRAIIIFVVVFAFTRVRLTHDDLAEKARLSEIGSMDEIRWAVLETNGDISFIKQPGS